MSIARVKPPADFRSAVSNFRTNALPHRYSVGGGRTFLFNSLIVAYGTEVLSIRAWVALAVPALLYFLARKIGRGLEQASVSGIVSLLQADQDKALLRGEATGLPRSQRTRLSRLLQKRGVVV